MCFWCVLLDPCLITYHSNIGVRLRRVTKLDPLILHMDWQLHMLVSQVAHKIELPSTSRPAFYGL